MEVRKIDGIGFMTAKWPLDPARATLVFIHGAGGSGDFWQAQVEGLSGRVNTLALDLPGHGRSYAGGQDTIEGYARSVIDFIKKIDVPKPIPCGLSMGGAIVLQLLIDNQDLLTAGILISTGARLKVAPVIFETLEKNYSDFMDMISGLVASKATDPEIIRRYREEIAHCNPAVTLRDFQACNGFDVMQHIGSIKLPVLVVSAEDDQLTPTKYGEYLKNSIPETSGAHIMDAGHISPMEKPEAFNEAVKNFLDLKSLNS
jgi:pimeloyl-ACP methyl ester carboxylesterase